MYWLLLIVRFVLRLFTGDDSNSVAMAARIDGRVEQHRHSAHSFGDSGWSLSDLWRRWGDAFQRSPDVRRPHHRRSASKYARKRD
jgi:hypothetical protein